MKLTFDFSATSAPHRARHGWTPLWLFRDGGVGAWYDPGNLATLFQDAAGTVPVSADGQPVGRIQDLSGNGRHAVQTISARRPTYRVAAGLHWLDFDGIDDMLVLTSPINLNAGVAFLAGVEKAGASGLRVLLSGGVGGYLAVYGTGTARGLAKNSGGTNRLVDTPAAFPMTAARAVRLLNTGGSIFARSRAAATIYTNAVASTSTTGLLNTSFLGAFDANAAAPAAMRLYGLVLRSTATTEAESDRTLTFLDRKTGAPA